jgi:hypothetical protein
MTTEEYERAGVLSRIGWMLDHGHDSSYFDKQFGAGTPRMSYATSIALWRAGVKAHQAGASALSPTYDGKVPVGAIPGYYSGRTGYKYTVLVEWLDPPTGELKYTTQIYQETRQMTRAALSAAARQSPPQKRVQTLGGKLYEADQEPWVLAGIEVQTLERW